LKIIKCKSKAQFEFHNPHSAFLNPQSTIPSWGSEKLEPLDLESFLEIAILLFICIVYIVLIVEIVEAKLPFLENTADLLWLF
jgi:hypothetical protein